MSEKDRFIQAALIRWLKRDLENDGKVTILVTEDSKNKNWLNTENDTIVGLKPSLEEEFPNINAREVLVPTGKNEEEIMEIFETIYGDSRIFFSGRSVTFLSSTACARKYLRADNILYLPLCEINYTVRS